MNKILDYFYSLLETYGGKICSWSWSKRWKNREVGTGYETNESWKDGYRKWKGNLSMSSKLFVAKGKKIKAYSLKALTKKIKSQVMMTRVFTSLKEAKKFINSK